VSGDPGNLPAFGAAGKCLKCGRPVGPEQTMCDVCNAAGMVEPASTQMHGTLAVAIIGSVVGLAVLAGFFLGGVGPFASHVMAIAPVADASAVVTVEVRNEGTREGRARCEFTAYDANGSPVARTVVLSPEVAPGGSLTFDAQVPGLTADPARVMVLCQ